MIEQLLNSLFWPFVAAVALVVLLALLSRFFQTAPAPPYERRDDFLTPPERAFFRVLEQAVDGEWYIFAKVRIADILRVPKGTENARGWFARIGQKHVDFLLVDRESVLPVLVIELDDRSHDLPHRQERDKFVDSAFGAAGLPILHVKVEKEYEVGVIAEEIGKRMARVK